MCMCILGQTLSWHKFHETVFVGNLQFLFDLLCTYFSFFSSSFSEVVAVMFLTTPWLFNLCLVAHLQKLLLNAPFKKILLPISAVFVECNVQGHRTDRLCLCTVNVFMTEGLPLELTGARDWRRKRWSQSWLECSWKSRTIIVPGSLLYGKRLLPLYTQLVLNY